MEALASCIDRNRFARELASQRAHCRGRSDFYVAVLAEIEDDLAENPPWVERLEKAWSRRRFAVGWEAAHLLLANLHFAALSGEAAALRPVYPSCGGNGRPAGEVAAFLRRAPEAFWARMRTHFVQTNEVDRSVPWLLVAARAFAAHAVPFHFVEMGASAGLNLVGDLLPHDCAFVDEQGSPRDPPSAWTHPQAIVSRAGLDIHPRRLGHREDRLWLKACVWADDLPRLSRLDRATATFRSLQDSPTGPRLEACTFADAPAWLERHRAPRAGEGLLVFNAIGTVYLSDRDYLSLRAGMARALAPWQGRALWVEYERSRDAPTGPLEIRVHRATEAGLETRVLGCGEPRPQRLVLHGGWDWLDRS